MTCWLFKALTIVGNTATLTFDHAQGLAAKGDSLRGFVIAGKDGKFFPAMATISGESIQVSALAVAEPVAVRYDWANSPEGNLVNRAGLPAGPFRFPVK